MTARRSYAAQVAARLAPEHRPRSQAHVTPLLWPVASSFVVVVTDTPSAAELRTDRIMARVKLLEAIRLMPDEPEEEAVDTRPVCSDTKTGPGCGARFVPRYTEKRCANCHAKAAPRGWFATDGSRAHRQPKAPQPQMRRRGAA